VTQTADHPQVPVQAPGPLLRGWRYRAVVYSVALSALGYLGFSLWAGWHDVSAAVGKVGLLGILLALSLSLVNYGLRFLRWQAYLRALGHAVPWRPSLRIYLAGFALTTTPGKAGETLRSVLLKPWGMPYSQSPAAFFRERLSDLLGVVLLTLIGLTLYPAARPLVAFGAVLVAAGLVLLAHPSALDRLDARITGDSRLQVLLRHLLQVLQQARRCHRPRLLTGATALSILAWGAEAAAFYLILHLMGMHVAPTFAVFVYALSTLAGALSFVPGGLGGAEAVMVALLLWQGVARPDAVAATVLIRLITLWFAVGIGSASVLPLRPKVT